MSFAYSCFVAIAVVNFILRSVKKTIPYIIICVRIIELLDKRGGPSLVLFNGKFCQYEHKANPHLP